MGNRTRGILTETDREFLRSDGDYYEGKNARQKRYQRRRDIRGRITQSLLDFQFIQTYLDDELRKQIFAKPTESGAESDIEFGAAIESLIYWLYRGCREEGRDFTRIIETWVERAEEDYCRERGGHIVDIEVDFEVEVTEQYQGVEKLSQALMNGDPIRAEWIYMIPRFSRFPIDPDEVDVVRVFTSTAHHHSELTIVETILREHLGVEAEVENAGVVAELDPEDFEEDIDPTKIHEKTAAVPPEDFER